MDSILLGDDESDDIDEPNVPEVTDETIAQILSEWTSIPLGKLERPEMDRLRNLEDELTNRVKGQSRAVSAVARAVRRARSGLRDQKRPIASFLFCGPTGTGKTELCKTLASSYFGSEKDMIRIDMSEYMEKHTVSRLTGPPPGYVGYEEGGQLTEAVRRRPYSVILLDEMEKAHPDVLNILLQILEDGILTDGKGRTVNFQNAILVMTSNVGSKRILDIAKTSSPKTKTTSKKKKRTYVDTPVSNGGQAVDTEEEQEEYQELMAVVKDELEAALKPEFLNRIDEIVVFSPLKIDGLSMIAERLLQETVERAKKERRLDLSIAASLVQKVRDEGSAEAATFGARPMRRIVQRFLEDTVSQALVQGFISDGDSAAIELGSDGGERQFSVRIVRKHDNDSLEVVVDTSTSGIGTARAAKPSGGVNGELETETDTLR
mmetsp:Transcript_19399/g.28713  ORF Transcript_19399/g.28713 Transcript_19399/m.28713 type:complete len:434 (-) Transcript_19399:176-1477(-)